MHKILKIFNANISPAPSTEKLLKIHRDNIIYNLPIYSYL